MSAERIVHIATLFVLLLVSGSAAAEALQTRYSISILGLPMGRADFTTRLDNNRYSVSGQLRSAGLGALISSTHGNSSVEGQVQGNGLQATRYRLSYTSDGKSWASDVRFRNGRAVQSTVSPPLRDKMPTDFVSVSNSQLRSVVDPLSGLMLKGSGERLCNRTLPVYDGWSRLNLKLSPAGTGNFRTNGFDGQVVKCNARVEAIGGFRRSSSGLKYLQSQTIQIWLAPVGQDNLHAPVYVRIPTKIGPLTLSASIFAQKASGAGN
ncbi:DUF3108 domain-containing protein [Aureimonas fodinaquatilis]|uniref:DUF3108 domain-containing protein n=1 Tax=Aureimonas fodinaquatilis TaxID=2565783 RepID=A0A5B0DXP6_9HYPH|nr:DUF3108 domain-containing protein [Aureimonas fodinaquatilis]KAA0971597.1 DUF3108 domain-containing protein [Aureimonas fodinaquatilis]